MKSGNTGNKAADCLFSLPARYWHCETVRIWQSLRFSRLEVKQHSNRRLVLFQPSQSRQVPVLLSRALGHPPYTLLPTPYTPYTPPLPFSPPAADLCCHLEAPIPNEADEPLPLLLCCQAVAQGRPHTPANGAVAHLKLKATARGEAHAQRIEPGVTRLSKDGGIRGQHGLRCEKEGGGGGGGGG